MRVLRIVARAFAWLLLVPAALFASAWVHFHTTLFRGIVRDQALETVNASIRGKITVGHVRQLDSDAIVLQHVSIWDPDGRRVAYAPELRANPNLAALATGVVHLDDVQWPRGRVWLVSMPDGAPSIAAAFMDRDPTPSAGPSPTVILSDIRLGRVSVHGDLPVLANFDRVDVRGRVTIESEDHFELVVPDARLALYRGGRKVATVEPLSGRIHTDPAEGIQATTHARVGPDEMHVRFGYARPDDPAAASDPRRRSIDAELRIHRLSPETLRTLGYPEQAALLRAPIRGQASFRGPFSDLHATAELESDHGRIDATGEYHAGRDATLRVRSDGIDVHRVFVIGDLSHFHFAGDVTATVDLRPQAPRHTEFVAHVRDVRVNQNVFPSLNARGVVERERIRLVHLDAPYLGGPRAIHVDGTIGFDGRVALDVAARNVDLTRDPNLRRLFPGTRGRASADIRVTTGPRGTIHTRGHATVRGLRFDTLRAEHASVRGSMQGSPRAPRLDVIAELQGAQVDGFALGRVDVRARGGPRHWDIAGDARAGGGRVIHVDAGVTRDARSYLVDADLALENLPDRAWRGRAEGLRLFDSGRIEVASFTLASGAQRLEVHGSFEPRRGGGALEANIQNADLALMRAIIGPDAPAIGGLVDAHITLRGSARRPELVAEGAIHRFATGGLTVPRIVYAVAFDQSRGVAEIDASASLRPSGTLSAHAEGRFAPGTRSPIAALERARWTASVDADEIPAAALEGPLGGPSPVAGTLDGRLTGTGTIADPTIEAQIRVRGARAVTPGWDPLDLLVAADYAHHALDARVELTDRRGALGDARIQARFDLRDVIAAPRETMAILERQPWTLDARMVSRPLDQLPRPFSDLSRMHDVGVVQVALAARVRGAPQRATEADLTASLDWSRLHDPGLTMRRGSCARDADPRVELEARLRNGVATAEVRGLVRGSPVLHGEARAAAPVDRWLHEGLPSEPPPVDASVRFERVEASALPWICQYASGPLEGEIVVDGLFGATPAAHAELRSPQLAAFHSDPSALAIVVDAAGDRLRADLSLDAVAGGSAVVHAEVPIAWSTGVPMVVRDGRVSARATFDHAPVGPMLALVPGIEDAQGTIDGSVVAEGAGAAIQMRGTLRLGDVYVSIIELGQDLERIRGRLVFHGNWVEIDRVRAWDQNGWIRLDGSAGFEGVLPERARVAVLMDDFPVRQDGLPIAWMSGRAGFDAWVAQGEGEMSHAHLTTHEFRVRLPDRPPRGLQDLAQHDDVHVVGQMHEREVAAQEAREAAPWHIDIKTDRPVWVRRRDFAVQLEADLVAVARGPEMRVSGTVEARRGYAELVGKRFEIERAVMQFTGARTVDPIVDVLAVHYLTGARSGDRVTVHISGRMSEPELTFGSNREGVNTAGDALALMMGGRSRTGDATEGGMTSEAQDVLAGITAGVLTLTARRELGGAFPVLSVEAQDGGAALRAGIDAHRFVPDSLRGIVRGAYLEGFVATGGSETTTAGEPANQSGRAGGILELEFPRSIVSRMQLAPPQGWGVDLSWEP